MQTSIWIWLRTTWLRFRSSVVVGMRRDRSVRYRSVNVFIGSLRLAARSFKPLLFIPAGVTIPPSRCNASSRRWSTPHSNLPTQNPAKLRIPPTAVGGSFNYYLHNEQVSNGRIPPTVVGGLFIPALL